MLSGDGFERGHRDSRERQSSFRPLCLELKSDEFSFVFLRRLRFGDGRRPIAL
jgi:hypothetical protein